MSSRNLKYSQALATRYEKKLAPHKKKYLWVYTMENNDTNTDNQKFLRLGDQK